MHADRLEGTVTILKAVIYGGYIVSAGGTMRINMSGKGVNMWCS